MVLKSMTDSRTVRELNGCTSVNIDEAYINLFFFPLDKIRQPKKDIRQRVVHIQVKYLYPRCLPMLLVPFQTNLGQNIQHERNQEKLKKVTLQFVNQQVYRDIFYGQITLKGLATINFEEESVFRLS